MSDEQPEGWSRPEQDTPAVPPGWAPQQPPAASAPPPPGGWSQAPGWGPAPGFGPPAPPRPGLIPLRPLGVGEILDGAISALRAHPRIMLGLSAVLAVATQLVTVPVTWLLLRDSGDGAFSLDPTTTGPGGDAASAGDLSFAASSLGASGLQVVVTLVAALVLTGILTVVVSRAVLGQTISTREAWAQARSRVWPLLGVTGLVLLLNLGIGLVCAVPAILLAVGNAPGALVVLAAVLGGLAFVAVAVYLYTAFALAPAAIVLERQPVVASLRRSRALVRGAWWRTFGILLLVNIIAQVMASILSVPFLVLSFVAAFVVGDGNSVNIYEILPLLATALGTIVASAITWPFTAVSTALLYVDRRIRREALDIELARAAGVTPAAPAGHQ